MLLGFLFDQPSINIPLWKAKNSNYRELHWCSLTINIGWEISLTATNRWKSLFFFQLQPCQVLKVKKQNNQYSKHYALLAKEDVQKYSL